MGRKRSRAEFTQNQESNSNITTTNSQNRKRSRTRNKSNKRLRTKSQEVKEFVLPEKFQTLCSVFNALHSVLSFCAIRRQLALFTKVKEQVESICQHKFTMQMLRQLLYLAPETVQIEYVDVDTKNQSGLVVNRAKPKLSFVITENCRGPSVSIQQSFRASVVEFAKTHQHKSAMKKRIGTNEDFDDVPMADLPEKPLPPVLVGQKDPTVLQPVTEETEDDQNNPDDPEELQVLDKETLKAFRQRSRQRKVLEGEKKESAKRRELAEVPLIADMVHAIFSRDSRRAMYESDLVEKILEMHRENRSREEIRTLLDHLVQLAPQWCCRRTLSRGPIFRITREADYTPIRKALCHAVQ